MKIRVLFLDFYGTLVHEDGEVVSRICERIKKSSPFNPETGDIASYWWGKLFSSCAESFGENFRLQRDIELKSLRETLHRFCCKDNAGDISEELFAYWTKPAIFYDTLEFLDRINIPACIVSNIDREDIMGAIRHHSIKVTNIITSEDVRSYKPRPEIFLRALELMDVPREEVLHVGDSLSSDVAGAKSMGINTCWLNRNKKINTGNNGADIECHSLLELFNHIGVLGY
jgi:2-haloalkanoic acid dehalogenase type II